MTTAGIATVGDSSSEMILISADADENDIASGDFVENAVRHGKRPKYTMRGTEAASMSLLLRDGETDARKVFETLTASVCRARAGRQHSAE
jgi:hypothetical protein